MSSSDLPLQRIDSEEKLIEFRSKNNGECSKYGYGQDAHPLLLNGRLVWAGCKYTAVESDEEWESDSVDLTVDILEIPTIELRWFKVLELCPQQLRSAGRAGSQRPVLLLSLSNSIAATMGLTVQVTHDFLGTPPYGEVGMPFKVCWDAAKMVHPYLFLKETLLHRVHQPLPSWGDYMKSQKSRGSEKPGSCRLDKLRLSKRTEFFKPNPNDRLSALPDELLLEVVRWTDIRSQCALRKASARLFLRIPRPVIVAVREWEGKMIDVVEVKVVVDH